MTLSMGVVRRGKVVGRWWEEGGGCRRSPPGTAFPRWPDRVPARCQVATLFLESIQLIAVDAVSDGAKLTWQGIVVLSARLNVDGLEVGRLTELLNPPSARLLTSN